MKQRLSKFIHWQRGLNWPRIVSVSFFCLVIFGLIKTFNIVSTWVESEPQSEIKTVIVLGEPKYTTEKDIINAIQESDLSLFFELDVNQIQQRVNALPWVASTSVRKQWPDKLNVYVVEHHAVAIWNDDMLLNDDGNAFQAPTEKLDGTLPVLFGPEGSEVEAWHTFQQFYELLYINNFKLTSLALSERFSWQLWLNNGINLNLGRKEKAKRVQRFINLYPYMKKRKDAKVDVVDLRYDTGLAVSWKAIDMEKLKQIKSKA